MSEIKKKKNNFTLYQALCKLNDRDFPLELSIYADKRFWAHIMGDVGTTSYDECSGFRELMEINRGALKVPTLLMI